MNPEASEVRIDVQKLVELRALLADGFGPLIESFISNAGLYVSQIAGAVSEQRFADATAVAHKLKSSAAQLGLPDLAQAAERVEKTGAAEHLSALQHEQVRVCAALDAAVSDVMSR